MEIQAKICRWQRHHKVNGTMMPAKNQPPALGYKAMQWGCGGSGNATASERFRQTNRKPN